MIEQTETLWLEQLPYCDLVKTILSSRYAAEPLAYVHTYGCQQNVADSERMKGMLREMGYGFTDTLEEAALVLYNTCAVREHAEDRVFGNVGALKHFKRKNPEALIVLCGCMMQQEHVAERIKRSFPYVDLVFGTHVIHRLPELVYRALCHGGRVFELSRQEEGIAEGVPVRRDGTSKGWLPIMYGCNNYCSYCVVPYVRGRERSRRKEDILREAKELIEGGCKDITLLGQNVNSYGKGLSEQVDFADLLGELAALEGDFLLRFMTSHPKDCTEKLLDVMASSPKIAKHLHLPFQSGSDRVLKEMNRHYDREGYLKLIRYAKRVMPELSLTSDVIVGFPGESYEEFCETLSLVREVEYTSLYTFIYSPRQGTPAAEMEDPVSREEKGEWFRQLTDLQEEIAARRTASMVGKTYRVLAEGFKNSENKLVTGRTEGNHIIEFPGGADLIGQFCSVTVTESKTWILRGELAKHDVTESRKVENV